jgi:hypothetical protein
MDIMLDLSPNQGFMQHIENYLLNFQKNKCFKILYYAER